VHLNALGQWLVLSLYCLAGSGPHAGCREAKATWFARSAVKEDSVLTGLASFFLLRRTLVLGVLVCAALCGYASSLTEKFAALPLRFEENRGQAESSVRFVARSAGYSALALIVDVRRNANPPAGGHS
jgi:hypothetical protein